MTKREASAQYWRCENCFALAWGGPVHGEGAACPLKVRVDEAYIAMLDAQRMSYIRGPAAMEDMSKTMQKMFGQDEPEDF